VTIPRAAARQPESAAEVATAVHSDRRVQREGFGRETQKPKSATSALTWALL
jgi:hypothetical protein